MNKTTKSTEINELNIYEKLLLITTELQTVSKNLNVALNKTSSYKAVSEKDILDAVKPLEAKYGVYSFPLSREIIVDKELTKTTQYGDSTSQFIRIVTVYRFVNVHKSEEFVDMYSYGDGVDTQDKTPGKAMTYADKYALMKAYKISTGDDPDKDASPSEKEKVVTTPNKKKTHNNQEHGNTQKAILNLFNELVKVAGKKEEVYELLGITQAEFKKQYTEAPTELWELMQEHA